MGRARQERERMDTSRAILETTLQDSNELDQAVEYFLRDYRPYHSEFQIDAFIVSKGGNAHPWGMYQQCLRELDSRRKSIRGMHVRLKEIEIELEEAQMDCKRIAIFRKAKWKKRRAVIKRDNLLYEKAELKKQCKDCEREFACFAKHAKTLSAGLETLTPEIRAQYDRDLWRHRLLQMIAVTTLQHGSPPADIFELIPCLPGDFLPMIQHALSNHKKLAQFYFQTGRIPQPFELTGSEQNKLE